MIALSIDLVIIGRITDNGNFACEKQNEIYFFLIKKIKFAYSAISCMPYALDHGFYFQAAVVTMNMMERGI